MRCDVAESPKVKILRLELLGEHVQMFREMKRLLGHDGQEQTFEKMLQLLAAAIGLTSREQSKVRLYTRDPSKIQNTLITCQHCGKQFYPEAKLKGQEDGFREVEVDLR